MGLEDAEFLSELVDTNPITATDPVSEGSNHLRLLKEVLQNTFPGYDEAVTLTPAQLNALPVDVANNLAAINVNINDIANNLAAIIINTGEISTINMDAAFKNVAETIIDNWTFNQIITTANSAGILGKDLSGTAQVLIRVDSADRCVLNSNLLPLRASALDAMDFRINNALEVQIVPRESGSLLIKDISNNLVKAGIRNPQRISVAASRSFLQSDEAGVVRTTSNNVAMTVDALEGQTTINMQVPSNTGCSLIQGAGVTLRWLDGAGNKQGDRSISAGSVITLWWDQASVVHIWGNGLS